MQCSLDLLDLVLSEAALGKEASGRPAASERAETLRGRIAGRDRLRVATTPAQLLAEIADGYDWVVLGTDKWRQILEPAWYGSVSARDAAIDALPRIALAPRPFAADSGSPIDDAIPEGSIVLSIPDSLAEVSSTAVRAGRTDWMA